MSEDERRSRPCSLNASPVKHEAIPQSAAGHRLSQNQSAGNPPTNSLTFATSPAPPANPSGGAYTNRPDGYSFDASGNMINDGVNALAYDAENCLTSAGTSTYTCDAHGIRVKKTLSGSTNTAYIFSNGKDIAEYDYTSGNPSPGSPSRTIPLWSLVMRS